MRNGFIAIDSKVDRFSSCRICGSKDMLRNVIFSFGNHAHYEVLCKEHLVDLNDKTKKALEE